MSVIDPSSRVNAVFAAPGAVGHAERHAHVAFLVPAARVVGGALGFEVEINDVADMARM